MKRAQRRVTGRVLLLAASFALGGATPALAQTCQPQDGFDYEIEVKIEAPPVRIHRTKSRDQLGEMTFHGSTEQVLGLAQSNLEVATLANFYSHLVEGGLCVWLSQVEVILRYTTLDIFIAKEYPTTSCAYRVILEHEKEHTKVAKKTLQPYIRKIRSALTSLAIPRGNNPLAAKSHEEAEAKIFEIINRKIAPLRKSMTEAVNRAQAKVDSPQAYRNVRKRCKDW